MPALGPGGGAPGVRSGLPGGREEKGRLPEGEIGGHAPGGVRCRAGLMIGVKLKEKDAHEVLVQCAKQGLLILTAKELVRFLPPLTITQEDIDQGLAIFQRVLEA